MLVIVNQKALSALTSTVIDMNQQYMLHSLWAVASVVLVCAHSSVLCV